MVYIHRMADGQDGQRDPYLSIGQLARAAGGVTLRTIRFYEEKGLLHSCPGRAGRGKQYGAEALDTLQRVRLLQEAGFSLDEIARLLHRLAHAPTRAKARQQAHAQALGQAKERLHKRVQRLAELIDALDGALAQAPGCNRCAAPDCRGCPILAHWAGFGLHSADGPASPAGQPRARASPQRR